MRNLCSMYYRHELKPNNAQDADLDPDNDELNNLGEYQKGADPHNQDTDGDYILDGSDPDPLNPPSERRYYGFTLRELASIAGIVGGTCGFLGFLIRFVIRRKRQ